MTEFSMRPSVSYIQPVLGIRGLDAAVRLSTGDSVLPDEAISLVPFEVLYPELPRKIVV